MSQNFLLMTRLKYLSCQLQRSQKARFACTKWSSVSMGSIHIGYSFWFRALRDEKTKYGIYSASIGKLHVPCISFSKKEEKKIIILNV